MIETEMDDQGVDQVVFPVLAVSKGHISFLGTSDRLTVCSAVAWRKGFYKGLSLIDSAGQGWRVKTARRVGTVGPLWGFSLFRVQKLRVELSFQVPQRLSLEDVKLLVLDSLERDRDFWEAGGDFDEIEQGVRGARSVPSLVEVFSEPGL